MNVAEMHHQSEGSDPSPTPSAWDWRAELKRQERSLPWLARKTDRSESTVNKYSSGKLTPPETWLREAAIVLGVTLS